MTKTQIVTDQAPAAIGPYSQAIKANNMLFMSGQIPINPITGKFDSAADVRTQAVQVMENLQAVLKSEGLNWDNVVRCEIFLDSISDFSVVNEVYGSYFEGMVPPARQTMEVGALPLGVKVEISAIAVY